VEGVEPHAAITENEKSRLRSIRGGLRGL
jgi:hypothetical protein